MTNIKSYERYFLHFFIFANTRSVQANVTHRQTQTQRSRQVPGYQQNLADFHKN